MANKADTSPDKLSELIEPYYDNVARYALRRREIDPVDCKVILTFGSTFTSVSFWLKSKCRIMPFQFWEVPIAVV